MLLESIALALAAAHFGAPLLYYWRAKRWLKRPWDIAPDPTYRPRVTVIVPTYNEAPLIEEKLDNIYEQDYPRDKLEVIVVDSASTDGTPEKVEKWAERHRDLKLILIREPERRGMVPALNHALKHVSENSEIVVFTDADSFWEKHTLKTVVSFFADPTVGAVTTCIAPLQNDQTEKTYRDYYNMLRVAESKIHSTPIHNGTLVAFRKNLLEKIGGLPTYTGNNDSTPASLIAFMGYRAIQIDTTTATEPIRQNQPERKIRRAQHLILHFLYTKKYAKRRGIYKKTQFDKIWKIEFYLHVINPWLLVTSLVFFILSAIMGSVYAMLALSGAIALVLIEQSRTWLINQAYLVIASIRNIISKELIWKK